MSWRNPASRATPIFGMGSALQFECMNESHRDSGLGRKDRAFESGPVELLPSTGFLCCGFRTLCKIPVQPGKQLKPHLGFGLVGYWAGRTIANFSCNRRLETVRLAFPAFFARDILP